jgi:hypothetical protein
VKKMSEVPPELVSGVGSLALHVQQHGQQTAQLSAHTQELSKSAKKAALDIERATRVLGESLVEVSGELVRTRQQMKESAEATSRHQRALVRWTAVLSVATVAYAMGVFLPFFWRVPERVWVLWKEQPVGSNQWTLAQAARIAFDTKGECERIARGSFDALARMEEEAAKRGGKVSAAFFICLPDSMDPRGPKGK